MRMVACVSPVTAGTLRILDLDPNADGPRIRGRLGVVPQQDTLDTELSVRDNLVIYGRYFGLSRAEASRRADELLEFAQLTERANDKVEPLSGGMKRRLTIARSLINEPSILLLDEPTTGLDPQARHLLWERLYRLKQRGVTLVLTTHYMDEAEQLCDRLVVMDKAKIVAEGSPRQLIDEYSTREVTELRFPVGVQETLDGQLDGLGERIEHLPDRVLVYSDDGEAAAAAAHQRGLGRRPCSSGGPRWRTCSCASPGGASSTDGGRGRPSSRPIARAGAGDASRASAALAGALPRTSTCGCSTGGRGAARSSAPSPSRCCSSSRWGSASAGSWTSRTPRRSAACRTSCSSRRR